LFFGLKVIVEGKFKMQKILLAAKEDKWLKLLQDRRDVELQVLESFNKRKFSSCLNGCLLIMDQVFFDSLGEKEKGSIHRSRLVLLLDYQTPKDKLLSYSRASMAVFYHSPGQEIEPSTARNFAVFLDGVEQIGYPESKVGFLYPGLLSGYRRY
jgi:hypothetical protein